LQFTALSEEPDFWSDREKATDIMQQMAYKKGLLATWDDLEEMADLLSQDYKEGDSKEHLVIVSDISDLEKRFKQARRQLLFSGKYDHSGCFLSLAAGTGGVDASDFTGMLLRMYLRFVEKMGWKAEILHESPDDLAGIKSALLEIKGDLAYGWLKNEKGVHRLIRQSPFNKKQTRETSFCGVEVWPDVEQKEIKVDGKDLRIDVFRSSGHGGQSVNTTDSAVRVTHLPTGITVSCQNERSQLQNKQQALKVLYSRLVLLEEDKAQKQERGLKGEYKKADFGNQIRTYTLHPYKLAKDHRSGFETSHVESVLDGGLEEVIESLLEEPSGQKRQF